MHGNTACGVLDNDFMPLETVTGGQTHMEETADKQGESERKREAHTLSRHLNHLFLYSRHCQDLIAFLKALDRPDFRSRDCTCQ